MSPGRVADARRHVLHEADDADDVDVRLALAQRMHQPDDAGGAAHVALHVLHAGRRLDGDAAGIEHNALADDGERLGALRFRAVPLHDCNARGAHASLRHRQQRTHLELLDLRGVEDLDLHADLLQLAHAIRELDRPQYVGRLVDEVAGDDDAMGDRLVPGKGRTRLVGILAVDDELLQRVGLGGLVVRLLLRQILAELVMAQQSTEADERGNRLGPRRTRIDGLGDDAGTFRFARRDRANGRAAEQRPVVLLELCPLARAEQHEPAHADARRRQQLDGALALALELRRLGRLGDGATRAVIELLASAPERHLLAGEQKARCFQVGAERGKDDLEAIGHRCGLQAVCSQVMRVPRRPSRVDRGCSHPRFCRCRSRKTPDLMPSGKATSGLS